MAAYKAASEDVPLAIREALQDALEIALMNVPQIEGNVVVCPDVLPGKASRVLTSSVGRTKRSVLRFRNAWPDGAPQ